MPFISIASDPADLLQVVFDKNRRPMVDAGVKVWDVHPHAECLGAHQHIGRALFQQIARLGLDGFGQSGMEWQCVQGCQGRFRTLGIRVQGIAY